jgi:hypothetical protein
MIKITRTMANTMVIGYTKETPEGIQIKDPYNVIPMKEGIRLIPMDIELIGNPITEVEFTTDKIYYSVEPSKVIADEYERLLKEFKEGPDQKEPETETE